MLWINFYILATHFFQPIHLNNHVSTIIIKELIQDNYIINTSTLYIFFSIKGMNFNFSQLENIIFKKTFNQVP
jgi:hypothetical protein